ncbi:MAG: nucleoside hydrolase [SAR202 cluster bacterium]|jgi:purine nucleosidase|nr:nucleoside hydrolase [SAR202 cluster bacterium]
MTKKIVIDTDPGTDDALALIMALNSPELDIQGMTSVAGNARLADTTRNTLRLMEHLGHPNMPVAQGASRPLRGKFNYGYHYHGPRGLPVRLATTKSKPRPLKAPEYLHSIGYSFPDEFVLIALGPLTNVARAIQREPRLVSWIKEIVVMGGAVEVGGNVTPHAEFNIYNDPHAANVVFDSGIPVTLVGLDVCEQVAFGRDDTDWGDGQTNGGRLAADVLSTWFTETKPDMDQYALCDPLAVAAAIEPGLLETRTATVSVEEDDSETYGQTRATYGEGNVRVAVGVDVDRSRAFVLDRIKSGD